MFAFVIASIKRKSFRFPKNKVTVGIFDLEWSSKDCLYRRVCVFMSIILTPSYRIIIQSEKPPAYLEEKIEIFLDLLREGIVEMTTVDYASHVSSLVLSLSEAPKYLGKETFRYWSHIDSGFYDFKRRTRTIFMLY